MIQADNPLQGAQVGCAEKCLNASRAVSRSMRFIRGTQLQQLTDEYEDINANIMPKTLHSKKREDLPELYERAKLAQKSLKEVIEVHMPKNNITPVQQELAWIYLPEAEAVLE
ncbi:hypothetical protein H4Q26_005760 [Puccinia striiformis f. sp. tritici PST-130]|nr:hypothetical protein H4Q26_005760 [Puccinia striiformis f. sp. tritici PST-130]